MTPLGLFLGITDPLKLRTLTMIVTVYRTILIEHYATILLYRYRILYENISE